MSLFSNYFLKTICLVFICAGLMLNCSGDGSGTSGTNSNSDNGSGIDEVNNGDDNGSNNGDDNGNNNTNIPLPAHLQDTRTMAFAGSDVMDFGYGYDSIKDTPKQNSLRAITFSSPVASMSGVTADATMNFVETKENLFESLDISVSASYDAGLFSASAKFNYANSVEIKKNCVNVVIRGKVFGKTYEIRDAAIKPTDTGKTPEEFYSLYGDRYLYKTKTGAEYIGMLRIRFESQDEKERIEAAVSASGFGASVSASLATNLQEFNSSNRIDFTVHTFGSTYTPKVATNLNEFIESINDFMKNAGVDDSSWDSGAMIVYYKSYWDLPGYPCIDVTNCRNTYKDVFNKYNQVNFIVNTFLPETSSLTNANRTIKTNLESDSMSYAGALNAAKYDSFAIELPVSLNYPDIPDGLTINLSYNQIDYAYEYVTGQPILNNEPTYFFYFIMKLRGGYIPASIYEYFYLPEKYPYITLNDPSMSVYDSNVKGYFYYLYLTRNGDYMQAYDTSIYNRQFADADSLEWATFLLNCFMGSCESFDEDLTHY